MPGAAGERPSSCIIDAHKLEENKHGIKRQNGTDHGFDRRHWRSIRAGVRRGRLQHSAQRVWRRADIEKLRKDIAKSGTEVVYDAADVGKPADVEKMINAALKRFGAVDILINNAVTRHYAPVEAFPVDKWDLALAVNLSAAFHTIRLALPEMKKRNWGRIINMASIHATKLVKDRIDYMTTKAAIVGLTRAVALECATTGVTCNAIAPGWVLTPHAERQIARQMAEHKQTREEALKTRTAKRRAEYRLARCPRAVDGHRGAADVGCAVAA